MEPTLDDRIQAAKALICEAAQNSRLITAAEAARIYSTCDDEDATRLHFLNAGKAQVQRAGESFALALDDLAEIHAYKFLRNEVEKA